MRSVAATHDTVLKPTVTEYTTYAEIPNVVGLRASVKFGAFFKTAPALATRCAAMPGLSEACAPRPTRAVALEPHAVFRDASSLPAHDTNLPNDSSFSAAENVQSRGSTPTPDASPMPPPPPRRPGSETPRIANRWPLERLGGSIQATPWSFSGTCSARTGSRTSWTRLWRPMTFSKRRRRAKTRHPRHRRIFLTRRAYPFSCKRRRLRRRRRRAHRRPR